MSAKANISDLPALDGRQRVRAWIEQPRVQNFIIVLILLNGLAPFLEKLGFGKLPGDFRFRLFGRPFYLPVATTVLVSLVAALLVRVL